MVRKGREIRESITTSQAAGKPVTSGLKPAVPFENPGARAISDCSSVIPPPLVYPSVVDPEPPVNNLYQADAQRSHGMNDLIEITRSFRVLDSDVKCVINETPGNRFLAGRAIARAEMLLRLIEHTFSDKAFEGEIFNLNNSPGRDFPVSDGLLQATGEALAAASLTNGLFDPVRPDPAYSQTDGQSDQIEDPDPVSGQSGPSHYWRQLEIDRTNGYIRLPPGFHLDLSGILRGWAIEQAYPILKRFASFILEMRTNSTAKGQPDDGPERITGFVDIPSTGRSWTLLNVNGEKMATHITTGFKGIEECRRPEKIQSGVAGHPGKTILSVTVLTGSTARAEILADAAFLAGPRGGQQLLEAQPGVKGMIVLKNGATIRIGM
jgi:FAD:protein FMN transferase